MAILSLSLLGQFQAVLECDAVTQEVISFHTRKETALLAYLAAEAGRWQGRAQLAEMLWPEGSPGTARNSLRQALFRVRGAIKIAYPTTTEFLETNRSAVRLSSESGCWLDTAAFEAHLGAAQGHTHPRLADCPICLSHLQAAEEFYRGDFLAGMALKDSSDFDIWLLVHQEHYLQKQLSTAVAVTLAIHVLSIKKTPKEPSISYAAHRSRWTNYNIHPQLLGYYCPCATDCRIA